MRRCSSLLVPMVVLLVLVTTSAQAGGFKINSVGVNHSGKGSAGKLNFNFNITASTQQQHALIGYFYNAQTNQPLMSTSTKYNPYMTFGGQVAVKSGSLPGFSQKKTYNYSMSVPDWALDFETHGSDIKVRFYLALGDPDDCDYLFQTSLKFKLKLPHHDSGKFHNRSTPEMRGSDWRDRIADAPRIRLDGLGQWHAYSAYGARSLPMLTQTRLATVFQEQGRDLILGGDVGWRFEGSSNDWRELYDQLDIRAGFVLPRVDVAHPTSLLTGGRNVMIERRRDEVLLFSSIPLFRQLFQGRDREAAEQRALILFVTPNLVVDQY